MPTTLETLLPLLVLVMTLKKANPKYKDWATCLFEEYPVANPVLKRQVYFWTKAWSS
jgi:hypothetical protein